MLQRVWTISTVLSFSRIVLLAPFTYFLFADFSNSRLWAAGVAVLGVVTDLLDGFLARKLHQVTDFGKIIDPVADKIVVVVGAVMLVWVGDIPLWYVAAIVGRDVLILLGGMYIKAKKNIISQSNWPGKITVLLIALVLVLSTLRIETLEAFRSAVLWASVLMMAVSLINYVQRMFIGSLVEKKSAA